MNREHKDEALAQVDPEIFRLIEAENRREDESLRLIASENYASRAVQEATGSCLTNKYSEGYAKKRYYEGQQVIDEVEELAISRLKQLFGQTAAGSVDDIHVNVQPYSGSPANLAVYLAFCNAGDTIMGLGLPAGGHLTHGHNVSITGKYFKSVPYGVRQDNHLIDMDEVRKLAKEHRPKLLWAGTTAYPRILDFKAFREIADEVGAIFAADIAHIAGLVAAGVHPSPIGIADVVTSTSHKSFRGPRGAMIFCKKEHASKIDRAVFPGLQGGPHNHTTAAIAVAAQEALQPSFKEYARAIVDNAKALAEAMTARGFSLVTGGTDNHLLLVDLTNKTIPGKVASKALDRANIVLNYNSVPFDPRKPFDPSGIRIGTPSVTSRKMGKDVMVQLAEWIDRVVSAPEDESVISKVAAEVRAVCAKYPAPGLRV
ncbi:serine hydroxymethyltransferase [Pendulispora brunnea]|uniref:Serine hydroxymethyltransferase n=1 Tax=Pendulispora brunnea TaxID=2905690 RepID=A0ABZ2KFT2_9BACT